MARHRERSVIVIDDEDGPSSANCNEVLQGNSICRGFRISVEATSRPHPWHRTSFQASRCAATNAVSHLQQTTDNLILNPSSHISNSDVFRARYITSTLEDISPGSSLSTETSSISRVGSTRSVTSMSPTSYLDLASPSMEGTSHNPIDLEEGQIRRRKKVSLKSQLSTSPETVLSRDDVLEKRKSSHYGYRKGHVLHRTFVDLDNIDGDLTLWNYEELQFHRADDTSSTAPTNRRRDTLTNVGLPQRNIPVVLPFASLDSIMYMRYILRPKKMVELSDGDFLHITDIIHNCSTGENTLRGLRHQRANALNGMLERKLNELCLFYEIDLDDRRKPQEQSVVEVPIDKVKTLRSIRRTNLPFPEGRNVNPAQFRSKEEVAAKGGLTVRWVYTCKYRSADDRWNNRWAERSLEVFGKDECSTGYGVSDSQRRFQWRGETIRGGSHIPNSADVRLSSSHRTRYTSLVSETSDLDLLQMIPVNMSLSLHHTAGRDTARKRDRSPEPVLLRSPIQSEPAFKKGRTLDGPEMNDIKERTVSLQIFDTSHGRLQSVIDLESEFSSYALGNSKRQSQTTSVDHHNNIRSGIRQSAATASLASRLSIWSSESSTPPYIGSIYSNGLLAQGPTTRAPGQMLTFGDAFCGAGGTTRGAAMAGLKVKWGFDFWDNACTTWKANFSGAKCHCMSSDAFVGMAQNHSTNDEEIKVDILHLSPPCQFFSPAHTVNGVDDEMNTASLYAVLEVVRVVKPRVVTLEQTFGILGAKCRWYFASVIHMFAVLQFSVRWAIVPLATWGLPQRRLRLIIIGACPGEILPRMPLPTHSDNGEDGLEPFVTVNQTLSKIPSDATHHDPEQLVFTEGREMRPWDGNKILPRAMTTSGGQNYHPSGTRDFTLREYACLQGFPLNHAFLGSGIKKQIGNAVPPCVAKVLFSSIKRDLDQADGIVAGPEIMVID